jgi:serine-type D-Ala-D-Ala carboxypeptidase (penicillin-binding protein 5/6)
MRRTKRLPTIGVVILLLLLVGAGANALRPIPAVAAGVVLPAEIAEPGPAPSLPWPAAPAQGALAAQGIGTLAATPQQQPQPTASVAKVMTALTVVEARPLQEGEQGPTLTVTDADVADLRQAMGQDQSTVPVQAGEQLTEYQALQAALIPSANNVATLVARWTFGSVDAAVARMNDRARQLGMRSTRFADASGFSPQTVSTPTDLLTLGSVAMQVPVLAAIVKQSQAILPVAGTVHNVNAVLGQQGINGIKTGNSDTQGGAFLFSAPFPLPGGGSVLLVGVVMGLPTLDVALRTAIRLVAAASAGLRTRTLLHAGDVVARYVTPWGKSTPVRVATDVPLALWPGTPARLRTTIGDVVPPGARGRLVGTLTVAGGGGAQRVQLVLGEPLGGPPWYWRPLRPPPRVPPGWWLAF